MLLRYNLEWLGPTGTRRDLAPGRYVLGRGGASDIVVDATGVSREHAELIICTDRGLWIRDLGSTNGTRVDGVRITEGAYCGDVDLSLGSAQLRLRERSRVDSLLVPVSATARAPLPTSNAPTAVHTASRNLRGELHAAIAGSAGSCLWTVEALTRLLRQWCELGGVGALRIQDVSGGVVYAESRCTPGADLRVLAEHGGWQLVGDVPLATGRELAEAAAELLRWAVPGKPTMQRKASAPAFDGPGVANSSVAMREVLVPLARAAGASISVLLLGETGVGKGVVAEWIHKSSNRRDGPFLALNCAALPRDLLEAELFGVERGAATGVEARPGLFEQANGGSLFLDEVGDTAPETQVRLLRALEDGRLYRLGGRKPVAVDVRLIAATNRELEAEIAAGRFRLDLYHRLAGFVARLPPLRERIEDIAPLALHFFEQALARGGKSSPGIAGSALLALQRWDWPGNIRELRQAIERAAILVDDGEALDLRHLPDALRAESLPEEHAFRLEPAMVRAERAALLSALAVAGEHERAWTLLGIGKTSFYRKLREHGLGRATDGD